MGSQALDRRMSFREKGKKNAPRWNDKRNDITVGMATAGYHNLPTRWSEPQGKTWFLCVLLLVGRTEIGRPGGGVAHPRAGRGQRFCFSLQNCLPTLTVSPGWSGAT